MSRRSNLGVIRLAGLLSCAWVSTFVLTARAADAPALQLVLELFDGSRIAGTPAIDKLKITTKYADVEVKLSMLHTVKFKGGDRAAQVSLQNGDQLSGRLAASEITMKTLFGEVTIPLALVSRIKAGTVGKIMPDGLVLHYTFGANDGNRITDTTDSGNEGTVQGATYVDDGKVGGSMSFSGDRQAVTVGNPANLQLQDFTIMAWVKRSSLEKTSITWVDGVFFSAGQGGYGFGMHNDGSFFLTKIGFDEVFSSCQIHDKDFHHVAITKNGSKVVFYLDGTACLANEYNSKFTFTTGFAVGARPDSMNCGFLGLVNELAVFNRALSDDEVKDVYESQK